MGSMNWSSTEEGLFLGAYYYGYVAGNIPGGWFVTRFGFRKTFPIAIFISSILNLFTPWASYTSVYLASILRCLTGFLQGVTVSAVTSIWSSWAPPFERSIMVSVSFSGFSFGYIIINPAAGFIAEYISWEAVFYITGGIAIVWSILFFTLFTETPDTNPRISHQERSYIEKSIGTFHTKISKRPSIPWKSLLTSKRVLAIICAHFYDAWFQCAIPAVLPTFLVNVLDYDMTQSGLVLMLPFALQWTVSVIGGKVTDKLRKSGRVSTTFIRKFNTCFALICSGWLTAGLGYVKDSDKLTMALVCISFAISGLAYAGYLSNPLDIAPRQASIIITISNTIACSSGFLGPLLAGYVVLDKTDISQWQVFFWSTCILGNVSAIIYGILASGVEQKWAQENVKVEINNNNDVDQLEKFELKNEI